MSREIKFRAWDKEKKVLMPVKLIDWSEWWVSCNPIGVNEPLAFGERNSFKNEKTDRHILMQFTGLQDKNGNEIYEGDIVEERWTNPLAGGENVDRYKIETVNTSLIKMTHSSGKQQWDRYLWMRHKAVTVIGNIYENPELLEGENE